MGSDIGGCFPSEQSWNQENTDWPSPDFSDLFSPEDYKTKLKREQWQGIQTAKRFTQMIPLGAGCSTICLLSSSVSERILRTCLTLPAKCYSRESLSRWSRLPDWRDGAPSARKHSSEYEPHSQSFGKIWFSGAAPSRTAFPCGSISSILSRESAHKKRLNFWLTPWRKWATRCTPVSEDSAASGIPSIRSTYSAANLSLRGSTESF